ncbi:3D domain-containing protein [Flagellimonas sp. 2504JD4-2]
MITIGFLLFSCEEIPEQETKEQNQQYQWYGHEVVVSAYNSVSWQTQGDPSIAAWGDTLKPGMKSIAVSRDLLRMGLDHNTMVKIDTFPDTFYVKDKMNRRWRNRIDLYMGLDVKKAREWGRKKLFICYAVPVDSTFINNFE